MRKLIEAVVIASACAACAGSQPAQHVVSPTPGASAQAGPAARAAPAAETKSHDEAERLVIAALACWSGGLWSDAEGASEVERASASQQRCHRLIQTVYGTEDPTRYERLRAIDEVEVAEFVKHVEAAAQADGADAARQHDLAQFVLALAAMEREAMYARRAGDKVKQDIDVPKPATTRRTDEVAGAPPLSQSQAFEAMAALHVGDLDHDARAALIMNAMDRLEFARGLPKHLKISVIEKPFEILFGVAAPPLPSDPSKPPENGLWLDYLSRVASAAGHPVPANAQSLRDRELMAWGGIGMGLADRLREQSQALSDATELKPVTQTIVRRVETHYRADEAAIAHTPQAAR